jgi:L-2-hydroxyglutarate oxidase LhgO
VNATQAPVVETTRRPQYPLPWRNTPSGGENHLRDADGRSVYDGPDAAEMFRLYSEAAHADHASRVDADHRRRRGGRGARAWLGAVLDRVHLLLHRR